MPGAPKGETAHAGISTAVHNEIMATSRKPQLAIDRDAELLGATEIPTGNSAANDPLSQTEIRHLDSSAGSYDRIRQIRQDLRGSDIWIAVGIYFAIAVIAFVII